MSPAKSQVYSWENKLFVDQLPKIDSLEIHSKELKEKQTSKTQIFVLSQSQHKGKPPRS